MARGSKEGQRIAFQVTDDVTVESRVVIKNGAIAWGHVTNAKGEGFVGSNAKLSFVIESVSAVDGQSIPVRSAGKDAGGSTSGSHIAQDFLVAGGLGAIFSPGKQVGGRAGAEFVVFTKATKM